MNDCDSGPCSNGASCVDGVRSFTCACLPGYTGLTCGNGGYRGNLGSYCYQHVMWVHEQFGHLLYECMDSLDNHGYQLVLPAHYVDTWTVWAISVSGLRGYTDTLDNYYYQFS